MAGCYCETLYRFRGEQHPHGLSFEAGETLRVVRAPAGGWWEGEKDGAQGWFPSAYVTVLERPVEELRDDLPHHWNCYMSPQGRRYYVNATNNETTWEKPSSAPGTPNNSLRHRTSLPPVIGFNPERNWTSVRKSSSEPQINCVTFPTCWTEQQLLKPHEWSYCDYFWSDKKDPQATTGFDVLLHKQLKGKQMQKEMAEFIRERIKIEDDYAKSLSKLSQNGLGALEEGTLGEAWAQLKKSLADEAEVHLKFSSKLQNEVEKPFLNFRENFKKDMKRLEHHVTGLRKQLVVRYAAVEKARRALCERQKDLEVKSHLMEIKLSSKMEEDMKKAQRKSTQAGDDLVHCVDLYNQSQSKWFEEVVTSSLVSKLL
ncbi:growth arrest-specific protein 7-like isoform X2 [Gouania willdenowi]|uniref:growth arrest-specific protein 7-like isoform X2 n=1 Tax=Gouania willdenowi TaxID=441366 RepID=UPI001055E441|nr:growth arrest-specific protein 7-like isoform X2 [Gouania willdenowi]